ncbi:MAG: phosphoribosyltransferase [Bacteroidetes bacterium]|nr:MAG: phosphoribosyltransferase [Bacteroidota bacterium]
MEIINHRQIAQKIKRLAIEVMERNTEENELIVAGINNSGYHFAELLAEAIRGYAKAPIHLTRIRLNPAQPLSEEVSLELPIQDLNGKAILVVDDVANTGRTLFYACKPLLNILPKKLEVAVLVDRTHKSFPIRVDYVGLSLATTLKNHIKVDLRTEGAYRVTLQ